MFRVLCLLICLPLSVSANSLTSVGRIENVATGGGCTATLLSETILVTAAHCLKDGQIDGFVFRPSFPHDAQTVNVRRAIHHPLYAPTQSKVLWRLRFDIAIAEIERPVQLSKELSLPLGDDAVPGEDLFLVSWRNDGSSRPRQRRCTAIDAVPDLVTLTCAVQRGESGAPVFRLTKTGPELVAVISSRAVWGSQPVAHASTVRLRLPPLFNALKSTP